MSFDVLVSKEGIGVEMETAIGRFVSDNALHSICMIAVKTEANAAPDRQHTLIRSTMNEQLLGGILYEFMVENPLVLEAFSRRCREEDALHSDCGVPC